LGQNERLPELAADLVRQPVIAATGGVPSVRAAKTATASVPIVFTMGGDAPRSLTLRTSWSRSVKG
jgi:putative ABC transport system substrate-binding protein